MDNQIQNMPPEFNRGNAPLPPQEPQQEPLQEPRQDDYRQGPRAPQPPMDMMAAIKKALTTPTDFASRSRRSEFWWFTLFYFVVCQLVAYIFNAIGGINLSLGAQYAVMVALALPMLAVQVRRLHDAGHNGIWGWLFLFANIGVYASTLPMMDYLPQMVADPANQSLAMKLLKQHPTAIWIMTLSAIAYCFIGLLLIIFNVQDSDPGTNEYGPSPKYNA